jgi:alkylation response protein AidB-like acyl-CoA dehydrogenase
LAHHVTLLATTGKEETPMEIGLTDQDIAFRNEVRAFLVEALPPEMAFKYSDLETSTKESTLFWQDTLAKRGWMTPGWPKELGGCDWSLTQHYIYDNETQRAGTPIISPFGVIMAAPVIFNFGTEAQKGRFLPGISSGKTLWCQGYSEPGSGSDLASLKTSADRDGDDYLVNGQKIWTSYAHWADWMFCLVRTDRDAKKQAGISFLLIDMKTPGITITPIVSIDNQHHLNEVFFEDVRVPIANRIGEENMGWTYAKFLLTNERASTAGVASTKTALSRLKAMAKSGDNYSAPMALDPSFRAKLTNIEMELHALEYTELRALNTSESGGQGVQDLSSPLKLRGTELQQKVAELAVEFLGPSALPMDLELGADPQTNSEPLISMSSQIMKRYLFNRASTIYGGSSEVQRNIMAKMTLGL